MANSADINIYIKVFDQESKKLIKAAQQIENAFKGVESAAKDLAVASKKVENEVKKSSSEMKEAAKNANNLRNHFNQMKKAASVAVGGFISFGNTINNARLSMKNFGSRIESLGGRMNVLGQRMTFFLSLPVALAMRNIVKEGVAWDKQLVTIGKTTDLSNESLDRFSKELLKINDQIPVTNSDLGDIAIAAGKAGIGFDNLQKSQEAARKGNKDLALQFEKAATDELLQFTEIVALATAAWDGFTGEEAAASLVQLGAIFDLSISEMENMASTIAHVADAANLAERDIIDAMARMSNASLFEVPAQDAVAFATTLVEVTQIASRSGTEINSALFFMAKNIEDAASVAGSSADEFQKLLDTDPSQALFAFAKGLDEIESNTEKVNTANAILGQVGAKALGPISKQVERLNDLMLLSNGAWKENTRLRKEAARQAASINGQWTILIANIEALKLALFDTFKGSLVPIMREFNIIVTDITAAFESMGPEQKKRFLLIAGGIAAAVAAAGPLLLMTGLLITTFGALITTVGALLSPIGIVGLWAAFKVGSSIFSEVTDASNLLGGGWKGLAGVAVVLANTFGLIKDEAMGDYLDKLGITTDEYGFQVEVVRTQIEEWKEKIKEIVEKVRNAIKWVSEHKSGLILLAKATLAFVAAVQALSVMNQATNNAKELGKALGTGGKGLLWVVSKLGVGPTAALAVTVALVADAVIQFGNLKDTLDDVEESTNELNSVNDKLIDSMKEITDPEHKKRLEEIAKRNQSLENEARRVQERYSGLSGVFNAFHDFILAKVGNAMKGVVEMVVDNGSKIWEKAKELGKNMVDGMVSGVSNNIQKVKESIEGLGQSAIDFFKDKLGIHSPSRVFKELGEFTIDGFVSGVEESEVDLEQALSDAINAGVDAVQEAANGFDKAFSSFKETRKQIRSEFNQTKREIRSQIRAIKSDVASVASGMFNPLTTEAGRSFVSDTLNEIIGIEGGIGSLRLEAAQEIVSKESELSSLRTDLEKATTDEQRATIESSISDIEDFLSKHADYRNEISSEIEKIQKQESMDAIDTIKSQIEEQQAILDKHKDFQTQYQDELNEIRKQGSMDAIELLKSQFEQESQLQISELRKQIQEARALRDEQLQDNKIAFQDSAKSIKRAFKSAFSDVASDLAELAPKKIKKQFKKAIKELNSFIKNQNKTGNFSINLLSDKLLSYDTGGIVPGSFSQGRLIQAHGSEMILNPSQQGNLFKLLNGGAKIASAAQSSPQMVQPQTTKQEVHIHYEYSPKVGAMIASKGEQRDFMREIRKLMAEENQRYGIDPNLAYDTGIVTQQ